MTNSVTALCQNNINDERIEKLSPDIGSSDYVFAIIQDNDGFLWFATALGLIKYDGYKFSKAKYENGEDFTQIAFNSFCLDKEGILWVGGQNGILLKFNREKEKFIRMDSGELNDYNNIISLEEDSNGDILIGTDRDGMKVFDRKENKIRDHSQNEYLKFTSLKNISCIKLIDENIIIIGTKGYGLFVFDKLKNTLINYTYDSVNQTCIGSNRISFIFKDKNNDIWIGANNLNLFNRESGSFKKFSLWRDKNYSGDIETIYEDMNSNLWIGITWDIKGMTGLAKFDKEKSVINLGSSNGFPHESLYRLFVDRSNVLWIGTWGNGIYKRNLESGNFFRISDFFQNERGTNNKIVSSIFTDTTGVILIGAPGEEAFYELAKDKYGCIAFSKCRELKSSNPEKEKLIERSKCIAIFKIGDAVWYIANKSIFEFNLNTQSLKIYSHSMFSEYAVLHENKLIIGSTGGNIVFFDLIEKKFIDLKTKYSNLLNGFKNSSYVHTLHIDKKGILWIGTFTEGLFEYNFEENVLRIYKNDKNDSNSISDNQVTAITEDSNGSLWIGTGSEGINKFDYSKKKFVRYGIKNGLTGYCSSILEDNNRFLWIGSNEGLYKFDPEKERAVLYKLNDDVSFYNYGPSSICVKDKDGTLYFGSKYGLIYFNPSEIKDNPYIPNIVLTDFQILNESVNPSPENPFLKKNITAAKDITLSYKDNVISFEFAALIYNNPSKNQYAYMMEGFDKDWVYCGTRRNVTYTNLDPGEYTFRVKGSNNDGLWNEEGASVKLIIIPPWWQTWWFKSCGAALIFLTAGFGYKKRVNKLRREKTAQEEFSRRLIESQEEERKRIASSLHDTIAHDILLTKSKALLALRNPDDNENLKNALNEISDMSSETINDVRGISYNLHPHQLERLGFSEAIESIINDVSRASHIEFSVKVDNVDDVISKEGEINLYRVIQEAINNIIKHSKATEAELKVVRLENQIIISISDNGIGLDSRKSSDEGKYGFGLSGIAERVKILKGEFKVESEENSGTVLRISVPIVNNPVEIK